MCHHNLRAGQHFAYSRPYVPFAFRPSNEVRFSLRVDTHGFAIGTQFRAKVAFVPRQELKTVVPKRVTKTRSRRGVAMCEQKYFLARPEGEKEKKQACAKIHWKYYELIEILRLFFCGP